LDRNSLPRDKKNGGRGQDGCDGFFFGGGDDVWENASEEFQQGDQVEKMWTGPFEWGQIGIKVGAHQDRSIQRANGEKRYVLEKSFLKKERPPGQACRET